MKKHLLIAILIMLVCLSGAVSEKRLEQQVGYNLNIKDNSFLPSTLNVPVGATVEWHNQDGVQHTVTSDIQGLFDSGVLMPGKKFTFTFNAPGSFGYHCNINPGMQGVITVTGTAALQDAASWSEEPLSSSEQIVSANLQSERRDATEGSSLQPQLSPATDQISLQKFSQYYRSTSEAPVDQLTTPTKIDSNEAEPAMLYFGSTQKAVPYAQYQTYALSTGTNSLWISGSSSWTQYAMVPLGSMLSLITMSSAGGYGYLYEIYPDGNLDKNSYYFNPYNHIGFYADKVGQHQLFFNIAGQPSNVIVIDVAAYQTPAQPVNDFAAITISSSWLRGYNVYVDGSHKATEGMTGDPIGTVTINVPGNSYHNIAIDGNGLTFSDYKYFKAGYAYKLNV
ncbi:MAG: cupredoxin domain-containing protein [Methanothrix sp.]|nr:cupredoxin domain-containing protein [Methanothrix sp.]